MVSRNDSHVFDALAQAVVVHARGFKGQDLSNIAWAFSAAGRTDPEVFEALVPAILVKIHGLSEQELACIARVLASAGCDCPNLSLPVSLDIMQGGVQGGCVGGSLAD